MQKGNFITGSFLATNLRGGAGQVEMRGVLGGTDFATSVEFVKGGRLPPGASVGLHRHPHSDELFFVLDGPVTVVHDEAVALVSQPTALLFRAGSAHGIYNHGQTPAGFVVIGIAPEGGQFDVEELGDDLTAREPTEGDLEAAERLDRSMLDSYSAHMGADEIEVRRLFGPVRDQTRYPDQVGRSTKWTAEPEFLFATNLGFVDHVVVPPGASVGYHRHDALEECQVFIGGDARMKVDGEVVEVSKGDCVPGRPGGSHGLINHTDTPAEFVAIGVCVERGEIDFTNLEDDLRELL